MFRECSPNVPRMFPANKIETRRPDPYRDTRTLNTINMLTQQKAAILYCYYVERSDTDFEETMNGLPNMKDVQNKNTYIKAEKDIIQKRGSFKQKPHVTCPVCYEEMNEGKVILGCNHSFCLHCYNKFHIRNNTCPLCRIPFTDKKYQEMPDDFLQSLADSIHQQKLYKTHNKELVTLKESIHLLLRNMNYTNMKITRNEILEMFHHYTSVYGSHVANFYGSQLFDS